MLSSVHQIAEETEMKKTFLRLLLSTSAGGLAMWIIAGLWHNLILPRINQNIQAHHDGLAEMLIAYFVLAFLTVYLYLLTRKEGHPILQGLKLGVLVGILWVFPHGLAMAGAHNTSIIYEIKNAIYHMFEQGAGGVLIAVIMGRGIISKNESTGKTSQRKP